MCQYNKKILKIINYDDVQKEIKKEYYPSWRKMQDATQIKHLSKNLLDINSKKYVLSVLAKNLNE